MIRASTIAGVLMAASLGALSGCIVTQRTDTPVAPQRCVEPVTKGVYWLYKPSYYNENRSWPMVVTLHGTPPWDPPSWQMDEWRKLAEDKGLIVLVPDLKSPQGVLPVIRSLWYRDLDDDERLILASMDDVCGKYKVDRKHVLLTGFSAGGYPMYYVGLRHPERFSMMVARSCNSDPGILERAGVSEAAKELPGVILWGRDEPRAIVDQSWAAFRFLREHGCKKIQHEQLQGGHLRRPEKAYALWARTLPAEYRAD